MTAKPASVRIHKTAVVETDAIGAETSVWEFTHIMKGAIIGENCNIGGSCFIERGVTVGRNCTIKNQNMLWQGIVVEDDVFIGPGVVFVNDRYPRSRRSSYGADRYRTDGWIGRTVIRQGASIGAGAFVLAGVTVGRFAMVGAGALIAKSVPDYVLALGNPAVFVGHVCKCGTRLSSAQRQQVVCANCGRVYGTTAPGGLLCQEDPHGGRSD
jgi:UDP-2-acetamido-3-amino-2,3-dideoxy-glucuronate N-acetyltransferase